MTGVITLTIIIIAIIIGIIAIVAIRKKKGEATLGQPNYRIFFVMGIIWLSVSIAITVVYFILQIPFYVASPLFIIGLVYLIVGLKNRDKWPAGKGKRSSLS